MKACFIGNSHLATLKRAWDLREDKAGLEPSFFGASANSTGSLVDVGGVLTTSDRKVRDTFMMTAGVDRITLADFDVFILVGVALEFREFLSIFKGLVLSRHADMREKRPILSEAAFRQTIEDLIASRPGQRLGQMIRKHGDQPIIWMHSPCPSEAIVQDRNFARIATTRDDPFIAALYETYRAEAAAFADAQGWREISQRPDTLLSPGFSLEAFSVNSVAVGWTPESQGPARRGDDWHMNADYGRLMLDVLMSQLGLDGDRSAA